MMTTFQAVQPSIAEVEQRFRVFRTSENSPIDLPTTSIRKYAKAEKEWVGVLMQGTLKLHNWKEALSWANGLENAEVFQSVPAKFFEKVYLTSPKTMEIIIELKALLYEENTYVFSQALVPYLNDLVQVLLETHQETQKAMSQIPVNKESTRLELYQHLYESKRYIDMHFSEKLNLKQVADIACLSECHFLRYFKATFDITPHQYVTQKRLEKAQYLLRETTSSIADISQKIGLDNLSSFSRLFKKHFGIPPEKFRKA